MLETNLFIFKRDEPKIILNNWNIQGFNHDTHSYALYYEIFIYVIFSCDVKSMRLYLCSSNRVTMWCMVVYNAQSASAFIAGITHYHCMKENLHDNVSSLAQENCFRILTISALAHVNIDKVGACSVMLTRHTLTVVHKLFTMLPYITCWTTAMEWKYG